MDRTFILLMLIYFVKIRSDDTISITLTPTTEIPSGDGGDSRSRRPDWNYGDGTEKWCDLYEKCCGKSQSPINFDVDTTKKESFLPIKFDNYDAEPSTFKIENNGHTVVVTLNYDGPTPSISDGGFNGTYSFSSFHFHWGNSAGTGSEHFLNGMGYPFELHIVHTNSKYGSFKEAVANPDGLAVLGALGEYGGENNTKLENVIDNLPKVKYLGQLVTLTKEQISLKLEDLLPPDTDDFFRYSGSLTIPKCHESVTWTVFKKVLMLSEEQVQNFRQLYETAEIDLDPVPMITNVRALQKLNNRTVYRRGNLGSLTNQHSPFMMLIAGVMILYFY